jgi:hypothetical protein
MAAASPGWLIAKLDATNASHFRRACWGLADGFLCFPSVQNFPSNEKMVARVDFVQSSTKNLASLTSATSLFHINNILSQKYILFFIVERSPVCISLDQFIFEMVECIDV